MVLENVEESVRVGQFALAVNRSQKLEAVNSGNLSIIITE